MQCLESIQPQSGSGVWTEPLKQHHGHFANLSDELLTKQAFVPQKTSRLLRDLSPKRQQNTNQNQIYHNKIQVLSTHRRQPMRLSKHRDSLLAETERTPFRAYLQHSWAQRFHFSLSFFRLASFRLLANHYYLGDGE